jgi:hypothetical protein
MVVKVPIIEMIMFTVFFTVGCSLFEAAVDADKIKKGKRIHHGLSATVRVIIALSGANVIYGGFNNKMYVYTAMLLVGFWMVFDIAVNVFRGKSAWYIGKTAWTDRMIRKVIDNGSTYLAFKLLILLGLILTYYLWV